MGFFDKVRDVLTTSDAERARTAQGRDAAGTSEAQAAGHAAAQATEAAPQASGEQDGPAGAGADAGSGSTASQPTTYRTHTVRHGDTLAGIAEHHGVDAAAMAELNRIDNPDLIYPGQVLRVPPA
ncbi:LysM peptidoglycan-binding domain-containing protein [Ornithinimicrobium pekingense]|uniref:LysM domain-containing protein n=1 Tax=Ornithinimicrobium pekingense TaxID=384677 RepID=A0ABQ2F6N4_9MICO|nr:LysM domain-containing protein [Ornithinimicrobium pekingense]GGK64929.1 hypothetical protein GCM10011509_11600 [Ornithinimicrobium pekingense]